MNKLNESPIDIVVPWVDDSDPVWREQKNEWAIKEGRISSIDSGDVRFRDWDIIRYLFRSIEKNMPWINKIHFVTWGHLPKWMNPNAEKLHIVRHEDYIPIEYLPTFSSHTIELNMHRIPELAQQFIYFNDDIVVLREMQPKDFFRKGLPCDFGILVPLISDHRYSVQDTGLTNVEIINDHFRKRSVIKAHPFKWYNYRYGLHNIRTLLMSPYSRFSSFYGKHVCNSFLKSSFEEVWNVEAQVLHDTCMHKFRTRRDVNQWLVREWQMASGCFEPISPKRGSYYAVKNDNKNLLSDIKNKLSRVICINDNGEEEIRNFDKCCDEILNALNTVFPEKSIFEK